MTSITIASEILLKGESIRSLRTRGDEYSYTSSSENDDMLVYPIGQNIPIIKRGEGCIGFAFIASQTIDNSKTTVKFNLVEAKPETAAAIYNLYRANNNGDTSGVRGYVSEKSNIGKNFANDIFED